MKSYKANSSFLNRTVIGVVTKQEQPIFRRKNRIYITNSRSANYGYKATISASNENSTEQNKTIKNRLYLYTEDVDDICEDDIIKIEPDGSINQLWDGSSSQNSILVTERCNCNCQICPQPPKNDDPFLRKTHDILLNLLNPTKATDICLTGGEPTMDQDYFINLLGLIIRKFPKTRVMVLTNAKNFEDFQFSKDVATIAKNKVLFCVSLQADTDDIHDNIVGAPNSFSKTLQGIHNLAKLRQQIEIRLVINGLNYTRLPQFSKFVYKNFPFVAHVAFMGLEIVGNAYKNFKRVWIDPTMFQSEIMESIEELVRREIWSSIYNIPLCLLDEKLHKFARRSISTWKNGYQESCEHCLRKTDCCGFFTTSVIQYKNIRPFLKNT